MVEVRPGYIAPPEKPQSALAIQHYDTQASGRYGSWQSNHNESTHIRSLRLNGYHFNRIKEVPVVFNLSTALKHTEGTRIAPALNEQDTGLDDLRIGAGFWPYSDRESGRHLMLAAVAAFPTGKYDPSKTVNVGENRKSMTLLAAYTTPLSQTLSWDSFLLYNRFGANPNQLNLGRKTQDDSASLTTYLVGKVGSQRQIYAGLEYIHGSDIYLNGVKSADGQRDLRGYLGGSMPLTRQQILGIRYGTTLKMKTGLHVDRQWILSLTHFF